jgi:hypothetical protein
VMREREGYLPYGDFVPLLSLEEDWVYRTPASFGSTTTGRLAGLSRVNVRVR